MTLPADLTAPAQGGFAIVPNDAADLPEVVRGIYAGTGGDLTVTLSRSTTPVTFRNVPAGVVMPVIVARVHATGTTAADLVGLTE